MALAFQSTGFSDALVILGAAGIVIPAFARLRISPVIGFILVGIAAGPFGLGRLVGRAPWLFYLTITDPHAIEPFAEFGITLLLFSIGLELSFRRLWELRRTVFMLGAAELVGCAAVLTAGLYASGINVTSASWLAVALALSSTALVLPLVGTHGPVGTRAFGMLLFEDLALVPILFVVSAVGTGGASPDTGLGHALLFGGLVAAGLLIVGRLLLPRLFAQAARAKNPELFLAASLLIVILASTGTAAAGLSPIVGALIAGILIAETDYRHQVELMTAPFRGLALGVFLLTVGMSIDPVAFSRDWPALLAGVAAVVVIKALVTGLLLRLGKARRAVALQVAILMAAPGETALIVLGAASAAGLIDAESAAFCQMVAAIGLTLTPLLGAIGRRLARRLDQHVASPPPFPVAEDDERVIVIGFGRVGRLVAQMLEAHQRAYLAIDADADTVANARRRGYSVTFGDIVTPGMVDALAIAQASAVVLTMDDPVQLVRLTRSLRQRFPDMTLIARARDPNHAAQLYRAGATDAVPETVESSLQLSEAVLIDLGLAVGPVIASVHDKRAQIRKKIMEMADLKREPALRRSRSISRN